MSKNKKIVIFSLLFVVLIAFLPLFLKKDAEFGGSDDAGSQMVEEIRGESYEPWFTPVLETALGGELPGEVESMLSVSVFSPMALAIWSHAKNINMTKAEKSSALRSGGRFSRCGGFYDNFCLNRSCFLVVIFHSHSLSPAASLECRARSAFSSNQASG